MSQGLIIHYDPKLVEEAVFRSHCERALGVEFDDERQRIYEIADAEKRDRLFQHFNARWFDRLALGAQITDAVQEQAIILATVESCYIVCAVHAKQEGAELYVAHDDRGGANSRRTLRITLRPQSLAKAETLRPFLRNELYHIADMLDADFGYEPALPKSPDGPTYDNFITDRYRVLWNVTICGRMARRGWLPASGREQIFKEFSAAFPMFHEVGARFFNRFYDSDQPRHAELAQFAVDPVRASNDPSLQAARPSHCPLCKFPTQSFAPAPQNLPSELRAEIASDFPDWSPALGLCIQCADLYRSRQMSMAALKTLPGWNQREIKPARFDDLP